MEAEIKAKVLIRSRSFDGEESAETVWAGKVGPDLYCIQNLPFFAYGVSLHDVVLAPVDPNSGVATFDRVVSKSGNRTLRLILRKPIAANRKLEKKLQELVELGCDYEFANSTYLAVNIPAALDFRSVENLVAKITGQWERADPAIED
jgi:hypothetical protein